jgi:putative ABC transport system permease protein
MFAIRQFNLRAVSIRTSNPIAAIREVETVWNRLFPDNVIKIQTVTQILSEQYRSDRGLGGMLAVGMVMAIFLAGCGTYALAAVSLQRRILEIVLRKLHGASAWQIARLFAAEFAGLFAMGALIALPLLALVGGRYVSAFTTQIALFWPIVLALVIAGAVTTIAVSRHAYRAMALRPAVALSL